MSIDAMLSGGEPAPGEWRGLRASSNGDFAPNRRLYLAVLVDALECIKGNGAGSRGSERAKERRDAINWMTMGACPDAFSFHDVCDELDLNPSCVRTAALAGKIGDLPRSATVNNSDSVNMARSQAGRRRKQTATGRTEWIARRDEN